MYFANTSPDNALVAAAIFSAGDFFSSSISLFAVVDMAFDSPLARRLRESRKAIPVGAKTPLSALAEYLPYVYGPLSSQGAIEALLREAGGRPMLSFVATDALPGQLVDALKPMLLVETPDGNRWPLRFADTRVLPEVLALEQEGNWSLSTVVSYWWWPDRAGKLQAYEPVRHDVEPATVTEYLSFNDKQFASLLNAAQPDAIIDQLYQACPEILGNWQPHETFAKVSAALNALPENFRDSAELEIRWSSLSLAFDKALNEIDWFSNVLQSSRNSRGLLLRLDEVPDEIWAKAVNGGSQ